MVQPHLILINWQLAQKKLLTNWKSAQQNYLTNWKSAQKNYLANWKSAQESYLAKWKSAQKNRLTKWELAQRSSQNWRLHQMILTQNRSMVLTAWIPMAILSRPMAMFLSRPMAMFLSHPMALTFLWPNVKMVSVLLINSQKNRMAYHNYLNHHKYHRGPVLPYHSHQPHHLKSRSLRALPRSPCVTSNIHQQTATASTVHLAGPILSSQMVIAMTK